MMLQPGPAAVVVVVADGYGTLSAQQAWHFVVESAPEVTLVLLPLWFPIAMGLTTPVPKLERYGPVVGVPHRRIEVGDLPVPEITLKGRPRKGGVLTTEWARTRAGVRVDEHVAPDLPRGYLLLERLSDEAVAWSALDGRFGRLDWRTKRINGWVTKAEGRVQALRAAGDAIAVSTASQVQCFDAECGDFLWQRSLKDGRLRLLDATRDVMVVANPECVIATSPKGDLWSVS